MSQSQFEAPAVAVGEKCNHLLAQRKKMSKKRIRFLRNRHPLDFGVGHKCFCLTPRVELSEPILE
jgi:hypothetical protein